MAEFPYTPQPAKVKPLFDHIQKTGVPPKVTYKYLESVGFKSKNDRYLVGILKFVGFLDVSGRPTEIWHAYRHKEAAPEVMAKAVHTAYGDLFNTYPDAYRKDNEALRNYFSTQTAVAESTLGLIVRTFTALCELADFEGQATVVSAAPSTASTPVSASPSPTASQEQPGMTVNINIQLTLPATEDASVYDKLFAAMKKYLLS
jgi:hypothetical protein